MSLQLTRDYNTAILRADQAMRMSSSYVQELRQENALLRRRIDDLATRQTTHWEQIATGLRRDLRNVAKPLGDVVEWSGARGVHRYLPYLKSMRRMEPRPEVSSDEEFSQELGRHKARTGGPLHLHTVATRTRRDELGSEGDRLVDGRVEFGNRTVGVLCGPPKPFRLDEARLQERARMVALARDEALKKDIEHAIKRLNEGPSTSKEGLNGWSPTTLEKWDNDRVPDG